ncbi:MAG: hypothetical protein ACOYIE_04085 [Agathobaculum sp.]|uniref:hypothetical protein n=1 Tax=Agathobaculum sp. TaxID=2048138 RepID=UPI003D8C9400
MAKHEVSQKKLESAKKNFEWMEVSMPCTAAQAWNQADGGEDSPSGIALPPHERDCGRSHPMRGTNSEDLTEWCIRHET